MLYTIVLLKQAMLNVLEKYDVLREAMQSLILYIINEMVSWK